MQNQNNASAGIQSTSYSPQYLYTAVFLACLLLMLMAQPLMAGTMVNALCNIVAMVSGTLARGLATLAVIVVGVGATLGKTSWGLALTVATGIGVIFNATHIVGALGVAYGGGC